MRPSVQLLAASWAASHKTTPQPPLLIAAAAVLAAAGDGAGMLCAMPDSFFSAVLMDEQSFKLPPLGDYAVGMVREHGQRDRLCSSRAWLSLAQHNRPCAWAWPGKGRVCVEGGGEPHGLCR